MLKSDVQNAILNDMTPYLTENQLERLKSSLIMNMHGMDIVQEETSLSTVTDDNMEYLMKFRNEMKVSNTADSTVNQYYREAKRLLEDINKNFRDVTYDDVMYCFSMRARRIGHNGKPISKRTLDTQRKHCKAFFNWLTDNEYINRNPFAKFKKIRYAEKEKETLTNAEIVMLRDACNTEMERALVDFLLSTGVRVSECCRMNINDINFSNGTVRIYGQKTRKWRKVYLDAPAQKHMVEYLNVRKASESESVFINRRSPYTRVSSNTVEVIVKGIAERAGVKKHCTVHLFRRTLATNLYKKGMPLKDIATILGNTVDVLEKDYIILDDSDVERRYNILVA